MADKIAFVNEHYPFDPEASPHRLHGVEKLRAIADRQLAADLYEVYLEVERRSGSQEARRREVERVREEARETYDQKLAIARRALAGDFGKQCRILAEELTGSGSDTSVETLTKLGRAVAELRKRK